MRVGARTDIGLVREHNEDSYYNGHRLWMVADGLGGHQAGEVASQLAVHTISQAVLGSEDCCSGSLSDAIYEANMKIYGEAKKSPQFAGMGTTITAALYDGIDKLFIGHVGDSRAYLIRNGSMSQLTEDHSVVAVLLKDGALSAEEAKVHPHRNYLTQALGVDESIKVDLLEIKIFEDDYLVLTTDGLTNVVEDEEIVEIVNIEAEPQRICDILTDMARKRGGPDNITVLVIQF